MQKARRHDFIYATTGEIIISLKKLATKIAEQSAIFVSECCAQQLFSSAAYSAEVASATKAGKATDGHGAIYGTEILRQAQDK